MVVRRGGRPCGLSAQQQPLVKAPFFFRVSSCHAMPCRSGGSSQSRLYGFSMAFVTGESR